MTSDPSRSNKQEEEERISSQQIQFSIWNTFKHHIPRFLLTILVDIILPLVIYFGLQKRIKPVYSLLVAGTPPLIMVIIKGILSRTFDALGFLVFIAFLLSAIVAIITHNPIILLLEKSVITGILSIIFGLTLIPLQCCHQRFHIRPLAYYFYQDLVPTKRADVGLPNNIFQDEQELIDEQHEMDCSIKTLSHKQEVAQVYEWIYEHCSSFRSACYIITSIWSVGFLLEFLGRLALILIRLTVNKIVIYGHLVLTSATIICIILTIICITKERKQTLRFIEQWKKNHLNFQQQCE
ncbi:unnamed protein product [Adineta steineri]|uniref:Uncharacterized protein n=1 Tax=Adineta steineri TaxID=433720 RepID=A0A813Q9U4_9BILA|nr:unnamed protein product [Adineta steineri]CAF3503028.1 unnamed protein product [Adineta steineri]